MVLRLVVGFAEKHDVVLGELLEYVFLLYVFSGSDPGTCRHTNAGLGCEGTSRSDRVFR